METQIKFEESKLQVHIKYSNKIELSHYTNSLNSLNAEYFEYIRHSKDHVTTEDIRLYVNEIRTGSIITELIAYSPTLLAFAENSNTIIEFSKHLFQNIKILSTKSSKEIADENTLKPNSLSNLQGLVEPILNDPKGQISLNGVTFGDHNTVSFVINSKEAHEIYNRTQEIKDFKPVPNINIREKVLLVFTQTNSSPKNTNNDKGIIESISKNTVKIRFANDHLKKTMLFDQHPYGVVFVVDIEIQTINDKPFIYKVLKLHECLSIDD